MEATFDGVLYLCKTHQPHHRRSNFSRLFRSKDPKLHDILHYSQLYHHQHAMQQIRWERPAAQSRSRKSKRNLKKFRRQKLSCCERPPLRPQKSVHWLFCSSFCSQLLPPKPSLAPAKAMTQFSRKSLKVKVQWTWAAAAALGLRAKQATPFNKSLHCADNASQCLTSAQVLAQFGEQSKVWSNPFWPQLCIEIIQQSTALSMPIVRHHPRGHWRLYLGFI